MRAYRLRLGHWVVASFEVDGEPFNAAEMLADAIAQLADDTPDPTSDDTTDDEGLDGITSGSSHDFERDVTPLRADEHHRWEWDDRGFGFNP